MTSSESRLLPILREGVWIVKMVFFKSLKAFLSATHPGESPSDISLLAAAVINEVFCTVQAEEPLAGFAKNHEAEIEKIITLIPEKFSDLGVPLTDAMRIQFLCDSLEGIDGEDSLKKARDRGLLLMDRDVPLPRNFLDLVRQLGRAHHILMDSEPLNCKVSTGCT